MLYFKKLFFFENPKEVSFYGMVRIGNLIPRAMKF